MTVSRPHIPYEHPTLAWYGKLAKERWQRWRCAKPRFTKHDAAIKARFASQVESCSAVDATVQRHGLKEQCDALVAYIAEAFEHYAVDDFTHAYYPGRPSQQGARTDAMEGASRVFPLIAAWLSQTQASTLVGLDGKPLELAQWLSKAFLAGTCPQHSGYWGRLHDYDQRTCESADIALALWLSRDHVWRHYTPEQQQQVITWLKQVNDVAVVDNNWHLFPLLVQVVIKALTGENTIASWRLERLAEFSVGQGWYRDGERGNFDYYNAWGFHYGLYWLHIIDAETAPLSTVTDLRKFSNHFRYLFSPQGFPFFGRSACYRLAATAPLFTALDCLPASQRTYLGQAKRALRTQLEWFISQGALVNGLPTQGLFSEDVRLIDNYSGPASSLWSMRSLVVALFCGERIGLWAAHEQPLEIEKGDFLFSISHIDAFVCGFSKTQEIVFTFTQEYVTEQAPLLRRLERQSHLSKVKEYLTSRACRPKNNLLRKGVTSYSSKLIHFL